MKKVLSMAAVICLAACVISCGNKKEKATTAPIGYESYSDEV